MAFRLLLFLLPLTLFAEIGYVEPWSKDAEFFFEEPTAPASLALSPIAKIAEKVILFHKSSLTHISGPRSHFRPSSSGYMLEAIRKYGFLRGYFMGCDRLMRENRDPWVYRTTVEDGKLFKSEPPSL